MLIFIAHRGNLDGPNYKRENSPKYLDEAIEKKFFVEVDIWVLKNGDGETIYLGHDEPKHKIDPSFLFERKEWLYCHAKNPNALFWLKKNNLRCFSHDEDPYTFVSDGTIWAYPGQPIDENTICVLPEKVKNEQNWKNCFGVCTDYVNRYQKEFLCIQ